jgi:predicted MPP superfamily phosphohydrolase
MAPVFLALAAALAAGVWCGGCKSLDTQGLEIAGYVCESPQVPAAFDGTRLALVTDIHHGPYYSREQVAGLVRLVDDLAPDLVLLGGDYSYTSTSYEAPAFAELARLEAPLGLFAVLGNHDYGAPDSEDPGPGSAVEAATGAGITLLRNQAVWLEKDGQRLRLGGVEDYQVGEPDLAPVVAGTDADDFVILLSHNPDYSEGLPADAADLVLSGHTHGGQVTLFESWAPYVPSDYGQKYRTGIVENGLTTVIISNGIGTSTSLPIRVFAPAQLVIVTLRHSASASVHP